MFFHILKGNQDESYQIASESKRANKRRYTSRDSDLQKNKVAAVMTQNFYLADVRKE